MSYNISMNIDAEVDKASCVYGDLMDNIENVEWLLIELKSLSGARQLATALLDLLNGRTKSYIGIIQAIARLGYYGCWFSDFESAVLDIYNNPENYPDDCQYDEDDDEDDDNDDNDDDDDHYVWVRGQVADMALVISSLWDLYWELKDDDDDDGADVEADDYNGLTKLQKLFDDLDSEWE